MKKTTGKIPNALKNPDDANALPHLKHFHLMREVDASGTSGTGIVALGVVFPSGHCAIEWTSLVRSIGLYNSIADIEKIHGHDGKTKIVFD